jgi:hypothetical protein
MAAGFSTPLFQKLRPLPEKERGQIWHMAAIELQRAPAVDEADNQHDKRDNQQDMNKPAYCV